MDFKGMKDQFADKAKDELLTKVDEVKQDISKKFGDNFSAQKTDAQSSPAATEAGSNDNNSAPLASSEPADIEQAEDEPETVEARGEDVDASEDADESKEEAA